MNVMKIKVLLTSVLSRSYCSASLFGPFSLEGTYWVGKSVDEAMVARWIAPPRTWIPVVHSVTCPHWQLPASYSASQESFLVWNWGVVHTFFRKSAASNFIVGYLNLVHGSYPVWRQISLNISPSVHASLIHFHENIVNHFSFSLFSLRICRLHLS